MLRKLTQSCISTERKRKPLVNQPAPFRSCSIGLTPPAGLTQARPSCSCFCGDIRVSPLGTERRNNWPLLERSKKIKGQPVTVTDICLLSWFQCSHARQSYPLARRQNQNPDQMFYTVWYWRAWYHLVATIIHPSIGGTMLCSYSNLWHPVLPCSLYIICSLKNSSGDGGGSHHFSKLVVVAV